MYACTISSLSIHMSFPPLPPIPPPPPFHLPLPLPLISPPFFAFTPSHLPGTLRGRPGVSPGAVFPACRRQEGSRQHRGCSEQPLRQDLLLEERHGSRPAHLRAPGWGQHDGRGGTCTYTVHVCICLMREYLQLKLTGSYGQVLHVLAYCSSAKGLQ